MGVKSWRGRPAGRPLLCFPRIKKLTLGFNFNTDFKGAL
jgi:hypothetical protein